MKDGRKKRGERAFFRDTGKGIFRVSRAAGCGPILAWLWGRERASGRIHGHLWASSEAVMGEKGRWDSGGGPVLYGMSVNELLALDGLRLREGWFHNHSGD